MAWHNESDRHVLARMGITTGRLRKVNRLRKELGFKPFKSIAVWEKHRAILKANEKKQVRKEIQTLKKIL